MPRRRGSRLVGEGFRARRLQRGVSRVGVKLADYRMRGLRDGLLGGSRKWMALGAMAWTARLVTFLVRPKPVVVYRTKLGHGETLVFTQHKRPPAP